MCSMGWRLAPPAVLPKEMGYPKRWVVIISSIHIYIYPYIYIYFMYLSRFLCHFCAVSGINFNQWRNNKLKI